MVVRIAAVSSLFMLTALSSPVDAENWYPTNSPAPAGTQWDRQSPYTPGPTSTAVTESAGQPSSQSGQTSGAAWSQNPNYQNSYANAPQGPNTQPIPHPANSSRIASSPPAAPPALPAAGPSQSPSPVNTAVGQAGHVGQASCGVACQPTGNRWASPVAHVNDPVAGWGAGAAAPLPPSASAQKNHGLFFRWDRMYFTMSAPNAVPIGDPNQEGVFLSNGVPRPFINSLDTGFINDDSDFGDRIEFGFIDPVRRDGFLASVMLLDRRQSVVAPGGTLLFNDPGGLLLGFQDADENGVDDDVNNNNVYGRNGQDFGTPDGAGGFMPPFDGTPDGATAQDNGDLVTFVPVFDEISASSYTDVSGLELMYTLGAQGSAGSRCGVHWLFGVRYLDIDDQFTLNGTGGLFDETNIRSSMQNLIIGPQIGAMMAQTFGTLSLSGDIRYLPGANFISGRQTVAIATNASNATSQSSVNRPINLSPLAARSTVDDEDFSAVIEWRLDASLSLTEFLAIRAGYTGLFIDDVLRGSGNINYTLPGLGIASNATDDISIHALTLGLEFYR